MLGVCLSIIIGTILGVLFRNDILITNSNNIVNYGLCLLLLFVGMDIGNNQNILKSVKNFGRKIWFLPLSTIIGSGIGGIVASIITGMSIGESISISMGLGWYSLSAIELSKISSELGSLAFLTNVSRELIAIIFIPFIAKRIGALESVSVAGATAMDTLLPIINKNTSAEVSIIAFFSGIVLTTAVPFLVATSISFFKLI